MNAISSAKGNHVININSRLASSPNYSFLIKKNIKESEARGNNLELDPISGKFYRLLFNELEQEILWRTRPPPLMVRHERFLL
jgi:hypothetical protein